MYLNILSNPAPVICGHVGGVQERVVLQDGVNDSLIVFGHSGEGNLSVRALQGNIQQSTDSSHAQSQDMFQNVLSLG